MWCQKDKNSFLTPLNYLSLRKEREKKNRKSDKRREEISWGFFWGHRDTDKNVVPVKSDFWYLPS